MKIKSSVLIEGKVKSWRIFKVKAGLKYEYPHENIIIDKQLKLRNKRILMGNMKDGIHLEWRQENMDKKLTNML